MADTWIVHTPNKPLPPFTVVGGHDSDGAIIYVGRAKHNDELLSAKVIPSKGCAYVAWDGQEHSKPHYEVLKGPGYSWVKCAYGQMPPNAVMTGHSSDGEAMYVGRADHRGSLCVGKVHPSHCCLYIPYGGQEIRLDHYEILIRLLPHAWMSSSLEYAPANAVVAGCDSDGSAIYVARAEHNGQMLPAKFIPHRREAYVASEGKQIRKSDIELLLGQNYSWVSVGNGNIPANAVHAGYTESGEAMFIGRAKHCGSVTPGLVTRDYAGVLIPFGGGEVQVDSYEILLKK
ncbi:uncharacterized protein [Musca autumnalis]|uniref:uncharacterized protein n=1 Tax=Musca autumnalis TaxID=221902 RepID=UPI003CEDA90B